MDDRTRNSSEVAGAWVGPTSVGSLFAQRARIVPDRIAVLDGPRTLTFAGLNDRANRLANVLAGLGVGTGDRVALLARNCAEYVEVELACAKIGAITACQNWRLADPELTHCLRLVEPALTIVQPEYLETLGRLDLAPGPTITIGEEYERRLAGAPADEPATAIDPETGFVILYTSGTTGLPKGALISHRAMIARAMVIAAELDLPRDDAFVAWPPFFHMASTDQGIASLLRGTPVIIVDGYRPDRLIEIVEQHRIGWLPLIPGMVEDFVRALTDAQPKIIGISLCGAMPDLVPPRQLAAVTRLLGAPYLNSFGATETGLPPATGALIP
ncbi:MAG: AMP-binding protein, partial [Pseudomonadota bacterium]